MHPTTRTVLTLATVLAATPALADGLVVRPLEHSSWTESVADLQRDANSEKRVIHVTVRDDMGRALPCGGYVLRLDAVAPAHVSETLKARRMPSASRGPMLGGSNTRKAGSVRATWNFLR